MTDPFACNRCSKPVGYDRHLVNEEWLCDMCYYRDRIRIGSQDTINKFHQLYYNSLIWDKETTWMGVRCQKCPLDLWIYQEIIFRTKTNLIIETGTGSGGTTLFLSDIGDLAVSRIEILSIDLKKVERKDKFITYLTGDSVSHEVFMKVLEWRNCFFDEDRTMVILDSDHSKSHVLKELQLYSQFVTIGNYLIVEDTNVNGHPVVPEHGPGPMEAVEEFLQTDEGKKFEVDKGMEKFFMTFNSNGYLRRTR